MKYLIASGRLAAGEELPPVRALAEQLLVTPNTVVKAYAELAAAGLVVSRRGAGTYVSEDVRSPLARRERRRILLERVDALLAEAYQMDFALEELTEMLQDRHAAIERGRNRRKADGGKCG